jgi:hypothetical protein
MKRVTLILLTILLGMVGCKKDDDDQEPAQVFILDGTEHPVTNGYLVNGKIYLMSDGLSVTGVEQSTGNPIYQGTGNLVSITAITGQATIGSGTYALQDMEGELYINWKPALTTFDYHAMLNQSAGSCTIGLNGLSCSVQLDGTSNEDGKSQQVSFSGELTVVSK